MPQSLATTGPYIARSFEDLAQGMIDYFVAMGTTITDLTSGSTTRTILEAVAQMGENIYVDQATGLQDAIAQSAFTNFNFSPLPAQAATGYLVFSTLGNSVATTLGANVAQSATSLTLAASVPNLTTGGLLQINDGVSTEVVTITSVAGATIGVSALTSAHSSGVSVTAYLGLPSAATLNTGTSWQPTGADLTYATTVAYTISAWRAGYFHIPSTCLSPGKLGNISGGMAGNILTPVQYLSASSEDGAVRKGDVLVPSGNTGSLAQGFINGKDPETPLDMRNRFTSFLDSLHRSTLAALEFGAKTATVTNTSAVVTEQSVLARAIDSTVDSNVVPSPGSCNVYIFNGIGTPGGQTTSSTLVANAQTIINGSQAAQNYTPGYKAAGIPTTVLAAIEYIVNLPVVVTAIGSGTANAYPGALLQAAVVAAIQSYFQGLKIGDSFILTALTTQIGALQGVKDVAIPSSLTINAQGTGGSYVLNGNTLTLGAISGITGTYPYSVIQQQANGTISVVPYTASSTPANFTPQTAYPTGNTLSNGIMLLGTLTVVVQ